METERSAVAELLSLCEAYKMRGTHQRKNIVPPETPKVTYQCKKGGKAIFLKKAVPSACIREGPILTAVRQQLPGTTSVCYNRSLQCYPHRDSRNSSPSHVMLLGDFTGGALALETGERFEEKGVWHGPFDFTKTTHWVEPFEGTRHSLVAFSNPRVHFGR